MKMLKKDAKPLIQKLIKEFEEEYHSTNSRKMSKHIRENLMSASGVILIAAISEWWEEELYRSLTKQQ